MRAWAIAHASKRARARERERRACIPSWSRRRHCPRVCRPYRIRTFLRLRCPTHRRPRRAQGGETKGGGVILRVRGGRATAGGVAHVLQEFPHARVALQPVLVLPVGVTEKRQSSTRARATAATGECPRDARAGDRAPRPPREPREHSSHAVRPGIVRICWGGALSLGKIAWPPPSA